MEGAECVRAGGDNENNNIATPPPLAVTGVGQLGSLLATLALLVIC